jgi:hypothetical protein
MARTICVAVFLCGLVASPALAEVDVRTPWANVYVGPGGLYVHGPWGKVDVPEADRERVLQRMAQKHHRAL